ncbi:phage head spike fiber domain-containing protein [Paludibaculum fermentans]|uniref:Carbohydrate binding domain-containing protein n=1 Tax=Paludibaculum fermentans TaxID=1473598 RepID=A0A7S7NR38_PALFE|nr:carbohydrate binding domain-containing protein [Paludibaculum fermentans]QOY88174.1 carbohydrate binding domain-containing protein [Paludibaculum fermentans]
MPKFPTAIDDASSLFTPVDAFQSKPLETTATNAIGAGDSTISVASTSMGFADTYGILSIDDELIIYAAKTANQFTGCIRGAFGTAAAVHQNGSTVRANMVSGFLTALQSAVLAIENELGAVSARNYVRSAGDQVVTGNKTFQDGAQFGSGAKSGTGLVRLPNTGGVKWRRADDSGDLGMALNAQNHLAMDAIVDFAPGQTFGAFSYPDAGYASKGIVQVDPAGGLAVESGVLSLPPSGASPGAYPKVTVDAKGRVTAGASIAAADLPEHTHTASDIVSGELPVKVQKDGTDIGTRRAINLVEGTRVTISAADDPTNDRVSVIVNAAPPVAGEITNALGYVPADRAGDHFTGPVDCGPHQTIGGPLENMAKHSENFAAAAWDKNGGSCSVTSSAIIAPDGNHTADAVIAVTTTPVIQQQVAGLTDGGTYTFYIWARVLSGTRKISLAIVNNAYAAYLAGPTQVTLTTSWQRFNVTGTLASGQTGLWIVARQFAGNGDDWTTGDINLWGACLQQGADAQKAYARTWTSQTPHMASGVAVGPIVIAASDNTTSPIKVTGPGSNLADSTLLELTANGELILAGGSGNGYRFAELMEASNPTGWSGVIKVKNSAGVTLGYILLYSSP